MNYILDTHTFLWFIEDSPRLSQNALNILESEALLFLSAASLWEIAIKVSMSKLTLPIMFAQFMNKHLQQNDISILPIQLPHLEEVARLPFYHRDPFDRLIIAQAIRENMAIIGTDHIFYSYPVIKIW